MFELISNAYLYNIVFVNNLPPYLKNSGSATGHGWGGGWRGNKAGWATEKMV